MLASCRHDAHVLACRTVARGSGCCISDWLTVWAPSFTCLRPVAMLICCLLTRTFFLFYCIQKTLPCGVRYILDIASNGAPVESVQDLRLNSLYACSSTVHFVGLDYGQLSHDQTDQSTNGRQAFGAVGNSTLAANRLLGLISSAHIPRPKHASSNGSSLTLSASLSLYSSGVSAVRPKIVALLAGACRAAPPLRPSRRAFRFLLNHRIALTFEQLLNEISNCVHLNIGAVHRVYGLSSNKKVTCCCHHLRAHTHTPAHCTCFPFFDTDCLS